MWQVSNLYAAKLLSQAQQEAGKWAKMDRSGPEVTRLWLKFQAQNNWVKDKFQDK